MKKITYILSNINKALAFEWVSEYIDASKFHMSFILLNPGNSALEHYLQAHKVPVFSIKYNGKMDLPVAIIHIYRFLKKEAPAIVHCHMFDACIAGLTAAKLAGIKKRLFTRHHATFHQVYFPRAVWYDKYINRMATDIIAISENVKQTLIVEGVDPKKIHLIRHGFKLEDFRVIELNRIKMLRSKYNPTAKHPVIGVISRYFELKGIQYIIPAFKELLCTYPDALLVLANANGNYACQVKRLLQDIPMENYVEISFEADIFALYQLFDIFIHVPIDAQLEAFGQTYVEALAAGIPSVFTLSGVAPEFITHHKNAWVVPFKDTEAIVQAMQEILTNNALKEEVIAQGKYDVIEQFTLQKMIKGLEMLYER